MISYYELLGMIKEGKVPNKIRMHLNSQPRIYEAEYDGEDFNCYCLSKKGIEDEEYKYYLSDSYLESMMFDKTIEILDKKKIPEKLNLKLDDWTTPTQCDIELSKKIDEIIDYLNSKGE